MALKPIFETENIDNLIGLTGAPSTLVGSRGNDLLQGSDESDIILGKAGQDMISGENGSDFLYGGSGNDTLYGGDDLVWDYLNGGSGNDALGGKFQDVLYGGSGMDTISVTAFDQTFINGGAQEDTLQLSIDHRSDDTTFHLSNSKKATDIGDGTMVASIESYTLFASADNITVDASNTHGWFGIQADELTNSVIIGSDSMDSVILRETCANVSVFTNDGGDIISTSLSSESLSSIEIDGGDGYDDLRIDLIENTLSDSALSITLPEKDGVVNGLSYSSIEKLTLIAHDDCFIDASQSTQDINLFIYRGATFLGSAQSDMINITDDYPLVDTHPKITLGISGGDEVFWGSDDASLRLLIDGTFIGNGDTVVDGAVTLAAGDSFSSNSELIVLAMALGGIDAATAAQAIGNANSDYTVGQGAVFVVNDGESSAVYQFASADHNANVSADELTLLATLNYTTSTTTADYVFAL